MDGAGPLGISPSAFGSVFPVLPWRARSESLGAQEIRSESQGIQRERVNEKTSTSWTSETFKAPQIHVLGPRGTVRFPLLGGYWSQKGFQWWFQGTFGHQMPLAAGVGHSCLLCLLPVAPSTSPIIEWFQKSHSFFYRRVAPNGFSFKREG